MSLDSFNRIATRPRHDSANQLIDRIIALRPDLRNETFIVPRTGNTALTVMTVNEVFKSGMSRGNPTDFAREYAVLEHLQGHEMGAAIPQLTWCADDYSIYGMTRLHGEPVSKELLASLPEEEQSRIAAVVGTFNAALSHSMTMEQREELGLQSELMAEVITANHVFEALEPDYVKMRLGEYNYSVAHRLAEYCLREHDTVDLSQRVQFLHPDMHENNIMYDRKTGAVSIIDIGPGNLVQPELAFCIPRHYYPRSFVAAAVQAFSQKTGGNLTCEHLDAYFGMRALHMSRSNPEYALGEFSHQCRFISRAIEVLEGREVSPAASSEQAPTPYVPNMR